MGVREREKRCISSQDASGISTKPLPQAYLCLKRKKGPGVPTLGFKGKVSVLIGYDSPKHGRQIH